LYHESNIERSYSSCLKLFPVVQLSNSRTCLCNRVCATVFEFQGALLEQNRLHNGYARKNTTRIGREFSFPSRTVSPSIFLSFVIKSINNHSLNQHPLHHHHPTSLTSPINLQPQSPSCTPHRGLLQNHHTLHIVINSP
jgi:hypothetical protein